MRTITRPPHLAAVLAVVASAGVLAGCGDSGSDKAGGDESVKTRVLTLADTTLGAAELDAFASAVEKRSGRRLRIDIKHEWQATGPDYETKVIDDVKAGKADLAWAGSRIWSSLGVKSLEPLQARSSSTATTSRARCSPHRSPTRCWPASTRRASTASRSSRARCGSSSRSRPSPRETWKAGRIGMQRSKMAEKSLRALGGTAVLARERRLDPRPRRRRAAGRRPLTTTTTRTSRSAWWPTSRCGRGRSWSTRTPTSGRMLSEDDRRILTAAGDDAREAMLVAIAETEQRSLDGLCRRGVRSTRSAPRGARRCGARSSPSTTSCAATRRRSRRRRDRGHARRQPTRHARVLR